MKVCAKLTVSALFLSLLSEGVLLSVTSPAQAQELPGTVRSATIDLNGDGKPEKVAVSGSKGNLPRLILSINNAQLTEKNESYETDAPPGFRIVKIDNRSKVRQIAVEFMSPNGLTRTRFYGWNGSTIRPLGAVENVEKIRGDGIVYGGVYMDFWTCREKYVLDPKTQTLRFVRQPTYDVGIPATVKDSFALLRDHSNSSSAVTTTASGSKIQLVRFWSPAAEPAQSTKANSWFLIKAATGQTGWIRWEDVEKKLEGLIYAG